MKVVFGVLLSWLFLASQVVGDTSFFAHKNNRLFAGSSADLTTAVVKGEDSNTYVAGRFGTAISGSAGSVTSAGSSDAFLTKLQADGTTAWLIRLGGTGFDNAECLAFDANSSRIYLGGTFNGTASFGSTNLTAVSGQDAFVACFTSAGALQWVRQIGGAGQETVTALKVSSYGLHVCGIYNQNAAWGSFAFTPTINPESMFVVLADGATGQPSSGLYASSTQSFQPESLAILSNGTVAVAGRFLGTAFFTPQETRASTQNGDYDLFVAAYDVSRNFQWVITGGGTAFDEAQSLFVSQQGGLVLGANMGGSGQIAGQAVTLTGAGVVVGRISEAGAWTKTFELAGPQLQAMVEGKRGVLHLAANTDVNAVTIGSVTVTPSGNQFTGFAASYLTNGLWGGVSTVTGNGSCALLDITTTADDGVVIGGYTMGSLKLNDQTLGAGVASLDAFVIQLAPPEQKLRINPAGAQVQVKYPAYYYNAALWGTSTLTPVNWTQEAAVPVLNTGEVQVDLNASATSRFYQLRFLTP